MINIYFAELEQLLLSFPYIQSYTIKKKIYNSKQGYIQGSIVFENGSRLDFIEVKQVDKQSKIKYRYHYMNASQHMVFRYDNAPHHPNLSTFPNHKHVYTGEKECIEPSLEDVLMEIAQLDRKKI